MDWTGEATTGRGVSERPFELECEGRRIPGLMWSPEGGAEGRPLLLLGHGGTTHKRTGYILATARRAVRQHGFVAVAIDGPGHGDRLPQGQAVDFVAAWKRPEVTEEIVADWRATLDAVEAQHATGKVGYFGLSMGTMMGVPLVAAEPRIEAAVLGLMGTWGPNKGPLTAAAPEVRCPVRYLLQWDDELIPRDRVLTLFDQIGSGDKSLRAHPGVHAAVPADEMREIPAFIAQHLGVEPL